MGVEEWNSQAILLPLEAADLDGRFFNKLLHSWSVMAPIAWFNRLVLRLPRNLTRLVNSGSGTLPLSSCSETAL